MSEKSTSEDENTQPPIPCLAVATLGGTNWFNLESNGSLLIGSGGHCKIQLEGDGVRSLHCIVALTDGIVELRDWNTGSTLLNGVAITDPVELQNGDRIRILGHEIEAILSAAENADAEVAVDQPQAVVELAPIETVATSEDVPGQIQVEFAQPEVNVIENADVEAAEDVAAPGNVSFTLVPNAEPTVSVEPESVSDLEEGTSALQAVESTREIEEASPTGDAAPQLRIEMVSPETTQVDASQDQVQTDPQPTEHCEAEENDATIEESQSVECEMEESQPDAQESVEAFEESETVISNEQPVEEQADQASSQEFVYDILATLNDETGRGQFDLDAPGFSLTNDEDLEELRSENEKLKNELAQQAPAPTESVPAAEQEPELLNREQALSMISRMQDLVEALKAADQRNHELEEQLRDATAAQVAPEPVQQAVPMELVTQMRDQVQALQTQLQSTLAEVSSLREQASASESSAGELDAAQQELENLRLEVSREREEISQQKVELSNLKTSLQSRLESIAVAEAAKGQAVAVAEQPVAVQPEASPAQQPVADSDVEAEANPSEDQQEAEIANQIASLIQRVSGDQ